MRKYFINRIITVILVFVTICTLTACSTEKDNKSPQKPTAEASGTQATSEKKSYTLKDFTGTPSDYSSEDNWLNVPEITKNADTFYLYPTTFSELGAGDISDIDNKEMRSGAKDVFERQASVFEESTNVFAPYYRQTNMNAYLDKTSDEIYELQRREQRTDVFSALDYYFEHYNNGRPFILAGHSQGAMMTLIILNEYMQAHPDYYKRMIAAYVVGFSVTKSDLKKHPYLKFAEKADDTGVIVSWNTEGPENIAQDNFVVLPGAVSINPLNWKRDETYASADENLGSRIYNMYTGEAEDKKPGIADAQVNTERGTVICTTMSDMYFGSGNPNNPFGTASLHGVDFDAYYYNIMENVKTRCNAYLNA